MIKRIQTRQSACALILATSLIGGGCATFNGEQREASQNSEVKIETQHFNDTEIIQYKVDNPQEFQLFAMANLEPASQYSAHGTVEFRRHPEGTLIIMNLADVGSPGPRAIHIHEHGDCSAEDFSSAGDHFNPTEDPHGRPNIEDHHLGDLGNILIEEDGRGYKSLILHMTRQADLDDSMVLGRSVVLHAEEDEFTQPDGDAGGRIACGVIMNQNY